ncbi:MAG: flagellar motor protein MotD [Gammaproteobacteria bacterium]|nr:flagellar motor protein MotD [Gammaproteobacteria bacterium]
MKRRHRYRHLPSEQDDNDRWLISYADFITLMFAFFVVMYAISSVNENKYKILSDTLVKTFKTEELTAEPIQVGKEPKQLVSEPAIKTDTKPAKPKSEDLNSKKKMAKIAGQLIKNLKPLVDKQLIKIEHNDRWVKVQINTSILFDTGSAVLENDAFEPLDALAKVLKPLPNIINIEGHTDNLPITTQRFPSNWELSAHRASSVVRRFISRGVKPSNLSAIGYGHHQPISTNRTHKGRRENRRVVIMIMAEKKSHLQLDIE